jgi:uncharacterized protein DUF5995
MALPAYATLDDVVAGLSGLEQSALARHDRRAVFLTVYGQMSREMKRMIEAGAFRDNDWVARYTVRFANFYREAYDAYETGAPVAKSWRIAFDTSSQGAALVSQDVLLGINAHINHDLALALEQVTIDPRRDDRLADHTAVNDVLQTITDAVSERISELYAPGLAVVDACGGTFDEDVSNFSIGIARENAWEAAVALANARADLERRAIRRLLDVRASAVARLILVPNLNPVVIGVCRRIEEGRWWKMVSATTVRA